MALTLVQRVHLFQNDRQIQNSRSLVQTQEVQVQTAQNGHFLVLLILHQENHLTKEVLDQINLFQEIEMLQVQIDQDQLLLIKNLALDQEIVLDQADHILLAQNLLQLQQAAH